MCESAKFYRDPKLRRMKCKIKTSESACESVYKCESGEVQYYCECHQPQTLHTEDLTSIAQTDLYTSVMHPLFTVQCIKFEPTQK